MCRRRGVGRWSVGVDECLGGRVGPGCGTRGHIGARADGNAHIRPGQGGSVPERFTRGRVAADGRVSHAQVVRIIDLLRQEKVTKFAINVRPEDLAGSGK